MSIGQLYTRLNNWIHSPSMQPVRRFWFTSVCSHLLLFISLCALTFIIDDKNSYEKDNIVRYLYLFILMIPIYPFVGLFAYLAALYFCFSLFVLNQTTYPSPLSWVHDHPLLIVLPLMLYLFVLYARQNKYIRHLVYVVPAIMSVLGTIFLMVIIEGSGGRG